MNKFIGKNIKAVFFDFDDTLVGTITPKWAHHKYVAKKHYGKDLLDEDIRPHWGKPFEELVCLLYETEDVKNALANAAKSHAKFPKILFDNSTDILKKLHNKGILTGIVTATSRIRLEEDLESLKFIRQDIDYTQTADDTPFHKPDPRVFDPVIQWLKKNKVKHDEVVYIADGLHDAKAAIGAGFHFIGVETGLISALEFENAGITSFPKVADIKNLFIHK